jgi:foldase protein PrsA
MSEGTHFTAVQTQARPRNRWTLILAGTVVAALAAGVIFQVIRAGEGKAGEDSEAAADEGAAGKVSLKDQRQREALGYVNGEPISYEEVARECFNRHGQEVLDNFINRMIIHQACRDKGIVVTEADVNGEVQKIAKKFDLDVENWYRMLQTDRNLNPVQYRNDIIWPMLALKKLAGEEVQITSDDMKKAFIRDYGPRVRAKMIMFDNLRRAQEIWNEANAKPEEFGRLAQKHSIDPTSKSLAGEIPPIRKYSGNDNLEKAAFALKQGEISPIVEVSTPEFKRFVVLKCEGRTEPVVTDMTQVEDAIRQNLEEEKTQLAVAKVFEKLKKEARVDNLLTRTTSGGVQQTAGSKAPGQVRPAAGKAPKAAPKVE